MSTKSVTQLPGAVAPEQPSQTYRLHVIRQRVRASEAVVDLLAELAFGSPREWVPVTFRPASIVEARP